MTTTSAVSIGKYRLVRRLGQGAMGQVYLAEDPYIGRHVAVKVMLTSGEEDEQRFLHEARIIGALSHPNIVVLHDFGFHEGRPYLVMEYVPGRSLQAWLREPHTLHEHLRVMEGLAAALVYAHGHEVLHRDLKPSNLQVMPDGRCKLMDFGIARTQSLLTASGQVMGTPGYMAPEVLEDASYSRQADIYSAGVLLYEMMVGSNPFAGQTVAATLNNVLTLQLPPLLAVRPDLPPPLAQAIMACLARNPRLRPPDLSALLEAVRASMGSTGTVSIEMPHATVDATRSLLDVPSTRRRRRASRARVAAAIFAMGGVAAAVRWGLGPAPSRPSAVPPPSERVAVIASPVPSPLVASSPIAVAPTRTPAARPGASPSAPSSRAAKTATPAAAATPATIIGPPAATSPAPPSTPAPAASLKPSADEPRPDRDRESRDGARPTATEAPVLLSAIEPKTVRRGSTFRLDVSGTGLQAQHRARVLRGGQPAAGIGVVRQEMVSANLFRIVVLVDEEAALGSYAVALVDGEGRVTNSIGFEVIL
jgi:eukaryotic-like serine/threonine-protein kinase